MSAPTIDRLTPGDAEEVRRLLVDLAGEEQAAYPDHPQESRADLEKHTRAPSPTFLGENAVLLARDEQGTPIGLCWCVLFDPGTGLEGEVAEVYVQPSHRGRGVGTALLRAAMALFRERRVTFACVWTRHDNPAAMAAYRAAGFRPTEQAVLTWLPLPGR